jgi:hypothetical protein
MAIFLKKELLCELSRNKLPCSYKSLLKYEKLGVIPADLRSAGTGRAGKWRAYTQEDIDNIVSLMKKHKS